MSDPELAASEEELRKSIYLLTTQEFTNKYPDLPISKVKEEVEKRLLEMKWSISAKNSFLTFSTQDYMTMSESFGPDLTSIPRTRFSHLKRGNKSSGETQQKKRSGYNLFFEEEVKKIDHTQKGSMLKIVGEKWKSLTQEERDSYNLKAKEISEKSSNS